MPKENWDTCAFQDMLLRQIESKEHDRAEHVGRIYRGQPNGNARMRDSLTGEVAALKALLGGVDTPTPEDMAVKVKAKLKSEPPQKHGEFTESYQNGWRQGLREMRGHVKHYLDPADCPRGRQRRPNPQDRVSP